MKNWKTTIGGALSAFGTSLAGAGTVSSIAGISPKIMVWVALVGFILSALGKFFSSLFTADASTVQQLSQRVETVEGNSNPMAFAKSDQAAAERPQGGTLSGMGAKIVTLALLGTVAAMVLQGCRVFGQDATNELRSWVTNDVVWPEPPTVKGGIKEIYSAFYSDTPTNLALVIYGTYVEKPKKLGYGALLIYDVNNYVGVVAGVDHVDQFLALSGGIQFQLPLHPLARYGHPNFAVVPFALSVIGTPLSGADGNNGGIETAFAAGLSVRLANWHGWDMEAGGAHGTRTGAGAYGGGYDYGFLAVSKGLEHLFK